MEKLLKKLGIDASLTDEEILDALEKKQMEYLDRLDSVEDDNRRKELKEDLNDIESAISSLSWSLKRRNSGVSSVSNDNGIMVDDADEQEVEGSLIEQVTSGGRSAHNSSATKEDNRKPHYEMAYKYFYGQGPYVQDLTKAEYEFGEALRFDVLTDEERGMVFGRLSYINGHLVRDSYPNGNIAYRFNNDYNTAVRYAEWSMELECAYGYYMMGYLIWNKNPLGNAMFTQPPADTLSAYKYQYEHKPESNDVYHDPWDDWKKFSANSNQEKAKEYFDKAIELGNVESKKYMWYWDFDALLEAGCFDRARYLAKDDADAWYRIYKKTNDIHDVRYAVKKGCVQAQQDLVSAEKEIEREQKKRERNRKNKSVRRYVITFLLMLIPSFIVSFYGILRIIDDIFGVDSFLVIFLVWFGVDVLATVIWRRIFD